MEHFSPEEEGILQPAAGPETLEPEYAPETAFVATADTTPAPLDRPLFGWVHLSLESALYAALAVLGVLTRFWDLGARGISHDESLHALYSWKLYAGQGYQHNPMMHGPFLFHANALVYFLFGDNDYTARVVPALFGVVLILLPLALRKWLGRSGALLAALFFAISPNFLYYSRYIRDDIYQALWAMLMVIALFRYIDERKDKWLYLGGASLILSILTMEATYIFAFIGFTFIVITAAWDILGPQLRRALRLAGIVLFLALVALSGVILVLESRGEAPATIAQLSNFVQYFLVLAGLDLGALFLTAIYSSPRGQMLAALRSVSARALIIAVLIMLIIFALLSTTFFTNAAGLWTAGGGAIAYWLDQHGVQRGGQPWYYYIYLLIPLYEFLPFVFAIAGLGKYLIGGVRERNEGQDRLFVGFLIFWMIGALVLYSWAGEKMPWLVVHPVQPMILLAGRFLGDLFESTDWRTVRERGGLYLGLTFALLALAFVTLLGVQPFSGFSLSRLQETGQWLVAAIAFVVLLLLAARLISRLQSRNALRVLVATVVVLLGLATWRFAWMATYINYDYASEFLVYAHAGPDVKLAVGEIEELSRRIAGDKEIKVAYDDDSTWPLEWYFREYPNRAFYGAQPTREALDAPVVIVGDKNIDKARPFLGKKYNQYRYRLVWWPIEDYKNISLRGMWDTLMDPQRRSALWDVVFYRKYQTPFSNWPFVHRFYMYVRKDIDAQLWDRGGGSGTDILTSDPYAKGEKQVSSILTFGDRGSGPGQFTDPRGVALDSAGNIFVTDSNNHRVQKFDPQGKVLMEWGSQGENPGEFQEPWGIAVDKAGNIYVADTWNHRIQKFDPQGKLLLQWGSFADTKGAPDGEQGAFWGPRSIAINSRGEVIVSDTGNKRLEVFNPDGKFIRQVGQVGALEGYFQEPAGLAVDNDDNLYVADTWNRRIQKFDADYNYVTEWPISGWESESVVNKPYLATDSTGNVYATDPENYRVLKFDGQGTFLASWGQFGIDSSAFNLPVGIAVDPQGDVFVADSGNQRVMKFGPVQ